MAEQIPSGPFMTWLEQRHEQFEREFESGASGTPPTERLASLLGLNERALWRYRAGRRAGSRDGVKGDYESETFARDGVERALDHAGIAIDELYPELEPPQVEDGPIEERWCGRCRDLVMTNHERLCLWCENPTDAAPELAKRWCEACDRMLFPTGEGRCWRCGARMQALPWQDCACGCGAQIPRFDEHGRRLEFALGHAPRSRERRGVPVPAGPFRSYLEQALRELDLLEALARQHGLKREDVVRVLRAEPEEELERELVQKALWRAGKASLGAQSGWRPDVPRFSELYADDARSLKCPRCGGGKARQAEMCKRCRIKHNREHGIKPQPQPTRIGAAVVAEAIALRQDEQLSITEIARRLHGQTPHRSAASLAHSLRELFRSKGIATGRVANHERLPDELLEAARRLHVNAGQSFPQIAARLLERSGFGSQSSLEYALREAFRPRGWSTARRGERVPDALVHKAAELREREGCSFAALAARMADEHPALAVINRLDRVLRSEFIRLGLSTSRRQRELPEHLLYQARRLREEERLSFDELATRLAPVAGELAEKKLGWRLREEFKRRGWPTKRLARRQEQRQPERRQVSARA